jgi:hypothetical protein
LVDQAQAMSSKRLDAISDYARRGYALKVDCQDCGHAGKLDTRKITDLCQQGGWSRQIAAVERRLKCSKCGGRNLRCGPAFVSI